MGTGNKVHPTGVQIEASGGSPRAKPYYFFKRQTLPAPSTYSANRRGTGEVTCCNLLVCVLSILTVLFILTTTIMLVLLLIVVQPRAPKYDIDNLRISGINSSGDALSLTSIETTFQFVVRNPNKKMSVYYDEIKAYVQIMGLNLGDVELPSGFHQGHKNTTITDGYVRSGVLSVDTSTQTALRDAERAGRVPVYVQVNVKSRLKVWSWKSRKLTRNIRCSIYVDPRIATGSQIVVKRCRTKRF